VVYVCGLAWCVCVCVCVRVCVFVCVGFFGQHRVCVSQYGESVCVCQCGVCMFVSMESVCVCRCGVRVFISVECMCVCHSEAPMDLVRLLVACVCIESNHTRTD